MNIPVIGKLRSKKLLLLSGLAINTLGKQVLHTEKITIDTAPDDFLGKRRKPNAQCMYKDLVNQELLYPTIHPDVLSNYFEVDMKVINQKAQSDKEYKKVLDRTLKDEENYRQTQQEYNQLLLEEAAKGKSFPDEQEHHDKLSKIQNDLINQSNRILYNKIVLTQKAKGLWKKKGGKFGKGGAIRELIKIVGPHLESGVALYHDATIVKTKKQGNIVKSYYEKRGKGKWLEGLERRKEKKLKNPKSFKLKRYKVENMRSLGLASEWQDSLESIINNYKNQHSSAWNELLQELKKNQEKPQNIIEEWCEQLVSGMNSCSDQGEDYKKVMGYILSRIDDTQTSSISHSQTNTLGGGDTQLQSQNMGADKDILPIYSLAEHKSIDCMKLNSLSNIAIAFNNKYNKIVSNIEQKKNEERSVPEKSLLQEFTSMGKKNFGEQKATYWKIFEDRHIEGGHSLIEPPVTEHDIEPSRFTKEFKQRYIQGDGGNEKLKEFIVTILNKSKEVKIKNGCCLFLLKETDIMLGHENVEDVNISVCGNKKYLDLPLGKLDKNLIQYLKDYHSLQENIDKTIEKQSLLKSKKENLITEIKTIKTMLEEIYKTKSKKSLKKLLSQKQFNRLNALFGKEKAKIENRNITTDIWKKCSQNFLEEFFLKDDLRQKYNQNKILQEKYDNAKNYIEDLLQKYNQEENSQKESKKEYLKKKYLELYASVPEVRNWENISGNIIFGDYVYKQLIFCSDKAIEISNRNITRYNSNITNLEEKKKKNTKTIDTLSPLYKYIKSPFLNQFDVLTVYPTLN